MYFCTRIKADVLLNNRKKITNTIAWYTKILYLRPPQKKDWHLILNLKINVFFLARLKRLCYFCTRFEKQAKDKKTRS